MRTLQSTQPISDLLRAIDHPARLQILLAIGEDEVCVCHLEALLGGRQAYISQHLMAMRKAGVLRSRRHGRFVFYRLIDPRLLRLIQLAAEIAGVEQDPRLATAPLGVCKCPACQPQTAPSTLSFSVTPQT